MPVDPVLQRMWRNDVLIGISAGFGALAGYLHTPRRCHKVLGIAVRIVFPCAKLVEIVDPNEGIPIPTIYPLLVLDHSYE